MMADIVLTTGVYVNPSEPRQGGSCLFTSGSAEPSTSAIVFSIFEEGLEAPHEIMRVIRGGLMVGGDFFEDPFLQPAFRALLVLGCHSTLPADSNYVVSAGAGSRGGPSGYIEFNPGGLRLEHDRWSLGKRRLSDPADVYTAFRDWLVRALASLTGHTHG